MSGDMMSFPDDWMEFVHDYEFSDKEEVYTNGSMLIPSFRVGQMVEHYFGGKECEIVGHYEASTRGEIGRERIKLSCGHIVERHSKYCQECGRKIQKAVKR